MRIHRSSGSRVFVAAIAAACLLTAAAAPPTAAQEAPARRLFSDTALAYVEIARPSELVDLVFDHEIARRIWALPQVTAAIEANDGIHGVHMVVQALESRVGKPWRQIVAEVTDHGVYLAFDPANQGLVVVAHGANEQAPKQLVAAFVDMMREQAEQSFSPDPITTGRHRDHTGYQLGQGVFAAVGPYLVIANKGDAVKAIVDAHLDGIDRPLADNPQFTAALAKRAEGANGWAFVRLGALRTMGVAREVLIGGGDDNPGAELLVGGVIGALRNADYATAELHTSRNELRLALSAPTQRSLWRSARGFFFAPEGRGTVAPLEPEGTILSISAYRDIAALWNAAPDLFPENVATQFAQIDAQLGNFFGGIAFGAELLPAIGADVQLVVVRQHYDADGERPVPTIRIPASALVLRTSQPRVNQMLTAGFQTLLSFTNIQGATAGRPALIQTNERHNGATIVTADYLVMADSDNDGENDGGIYWNFSPTLAVAGDRVILSSTAPLARGLVDLTAASDADAAIAENTLVRLDGPMLLAALADNRDQLVAQTMLSEGSSPDDAERRIDLLLRMLRHLRGADAKIVTRPDAIRVELGVSLEANP